jgi:hypothetical protein
MSKRISGPPRRPRNPVAKAVRSPVFRQRVVSDKRRRERLEDVEKPEERPREKPGTPRPEAIPDTDD